MSEAVLDRPSEPGAWVALWTLTLMPLIGVAASLSNAASSGVFGMLFRYSSLDDSEQDMVAFDLFFLPLAAGVVGVFVGILSLPIVVPLLRRTRLLRSIPCVFGPTLLVAVCWAYLERHVDDLAGLTSAVAAFVTVVVASVICYRRRDKPGYLCPTCNYDLRGQRDPGCPECGWGRKQTSESTGNA